MTPRLSRITIFPIKSLDGVELTDANVLPTGALEDDRRWALVDADGRFISGKRTPAVHRVRATYELQTHKVRLRSMSNDSEHEFSLIDDRVAIGDWLSERVDVKCRLVQNTDVGFPDDLVAPGPTLVSTATLAEVCRWFPGLVLGEARRRFRANLEIDGVPPFWEDRLVGPPGVEIPFQIGNVNWFGVTACQRCVVPSRASDSGEPTPNFQRSFATHREVALRPWAPRACFDHFYRLAVNTRLAPNSATGKLCLGDAVHIASLGATGSASAYDESIAKQKSID
jgi:uncharacterized protein YcbX